MGHVIQVTLWGLDLDVPIDAEETNYVYMSNERQKAD